MTAITPELLDAIVDATSTDAEARALVQRWRDVLDDLDERAERIRRSVREAPCTCADHLEPLPDGRCPQCFGRAP